MKKLFLLCSIFTVFIACTDDDDYLFQCNDSPCSNSSEDCTEKINKKSITRASIYWGDTITVYGYNHTRSLGTRTVSLNSSNAAKFGLAAGVYLMEYLDCTKEINVGNNLYFYCDSPNCGYKPGQNFSLDNTNISYEKDRGWGETDSSSSGSLHSIVLHLISNIYGIRYDRYSPCSPSNMEWKYEYYEF